MFRFDNKDAGNVTRWVVLGALGIFMIVAQRLAKDVIYIAFGIALVLAALSGAYDWWQHRSAEGGNQLVELLGSIALAVIGLWIFRNPDDFDSVVNVIIGLVLIVAGIYWLSLSRPVKDTLTTVLSIGAIVLGIIIASSHAGTTWLVTAEGISLLYSAVTGLICDKALRN